jgi:hypothetical protein
MRIHLALAFTLAATAASAATPPLGNGYGAIDAPRDITPEALGQAFCEARIEGDMSPLARYFAPKLAELVEASANLSDIPWQSAEAKPTGCAIEIVNGFDDTIGVLVRITYSSAEGSWSDTLNLERTPDSWLINNVFYADGGNLRFRLFDQLDM